MDPGTHPGPPLNLAARFPRHVDVYEVGPRDGLQNELRSVPLKDKLRLVTALVAAGERRIELTSFVSPKWIPQLADADELVAQVDRSPGVTFSALVPNLKGLERAKSAGLGEAAVFASATETHSRKNINKSIAEALHVAGAVAKGALAAGMRVRAYLSVVWGCPYEGKTSLATVVDLASRLLDMGIYQLSLGDTIGVGIPTQTEAILEAVLRHVPASKLALHLHDTRGTALANALVGLSYGLTTLDASIGGLGGCPYAPGAAGNLATEDLVNLLHGMGVETGIDLSRLVEAGEVAQELIGRKLPGKYLQAALGERDRLLARKRQAR
ncbi:MAG: hydroxymethylglutaryl-CoA lyase [Myxococcaceae bacterium]